MSKSNPSTTPTAAPCGCGDVPVPLSVLGLELDPPVGMSLRTWLAGDLVIDDLGRVAVPRSTARRLIADRDAAQAQAAERAERHRAELAARYPARTPVGVPAVEGMSAYEAMLAVDRPDGRDPAKRVTPFEEVFGGGR